jgi:hypothetical protein
VPRSESSQFERMWTSACRRRGVKISSVPDAVLRSTTIKSSTRTRRSKKTARGCTPPRDVQKGARDLTEIIASAAYLVRTAPEFKTELSCCASARRRYAARWQR